MQSGGIVNRQPGLFPIGPNGDSQSEDCFGNLIGMKIICADVTVVMDYALETQPNKRQYKAFRFNGDQLRGEFPSGRGTGEVLRTGHETREAGLPVV
jgi:hypothetical protein